MTRSSPIPVSLSLFFIDIYITIPVKRMFVLIYRIFVSNYFSYRERAYGLLVSLNILLHTKKYHQIVLKEMVNGKLKPT